MNIILRLIVFVSVLSVFFISCSEENPEGPVNTDVTKMVSFAQDTFFIEEDAIDTTITIVVPKYVNGKVYITLGSTDGSAVKDSNFVLRELEAIIPVGKASVEIPIETINDTLMNLNRDFTLEILSVKGFAFAGTTRQKCVVVIKNDDHPKEATATFIKSEIEVYENEKVLEIPFNIIKGESIVKLKGDAIVTFAAALGMGNATSDHFRFRDGGKVFMKEGDSTGVVIIDLINNDKAKPDFVWASIRISETEGVFPGESHCKLIINNDDIDRQLAFSEIKTSVAEDAGEVEISVVISGKPKFEKPIIKGQLAFRHPGSRLKFIGDSIFSVRGDTTLTFKVAIEDNKEYGVWGDTIDFIGVENVTTPKATKTMIIDIVDNERKIKFESVKISANEGDQEQKSLMIPILLEGGVALYDTDVKVSIGNSNTLEGQYDIVSGTDLTILKGRDRVEVEVKFRHLVDAADRFFELNISSTQEHTSVVSGEGSMCTLHILNIDPNVAFSTSADVMKFNNTLDTIYIHGNNLIGASNVELSVVATEGITYVGQKVIPLGKGSSIHKIPVKVDFAPNVKVGQLQFEISRVTSDDIEVEGVIHSSLYKRTLFALNQDKAEPTYVTKPMNKDNDGTDPNVNWRLLYYTTQEPAEGTCDDIIDNNKDTYWHSNWTGGGFLIDGVTQDKPQAGPYTIIYDMNRVILSDSVEMGARLTNLGDSHGLDVYIGDSGDIDDPSWKLICSIDNKTTNVAKVGKPSSKVVGRYVKLIIPEASRGNVGCLGEFKLFGY